jgi:hypothetical protein
LERLRLAILATVQGRDWFHIESAEMSAAIIDSIENCERDKFIDEVGANSPLPDGCRIIVEDATTKEDVIQHLAGVTDDWIQILKYPMETPREPFVSDFYKEMSQAGSAEGLAASLQLSKEELLDRMLLVLFDSLWLAQSETWTNRGVANIPQDEAFELARWFMKGRSLCNV